MAITPLQRKIEIVDENGKMTGRFPDWQEGVSRLEVLVGTGSPEGVVEAIEGREYRDRTGPVGARKYVKNVSGIGVDKSLGWVTI